MRTIPLAVLGGLLGGSASGEMPVMIGEKTVMASDGTVITVTAGKKAKYNITAEDNLLSLILIGCSGRELRISTEE